MALCTVGRSRFLFFKKETATQKKFYLGRKGMRRHVAGGVLGIALVAAIVTHYRDSSAGDGLRAPSASGEQTVRTGCDERQKDWRVVMTSRRTPPMVCRCSARFKDGATRQRDTWMRSVFLVNLCKLDI